MKKIKVKRQRITLDRVEFKGPTMEALILSQEYETQGYKIVDSGFMFNRAKEWDHKRCWYIMEKIIRTVDNPRPVPGEALDEAVRKQFKIKP